MADCPQTALRQTFHPLNEAKLSVVIVSYNTPEALQLCLESLVRQQPDEIVVADCSNADPTPTLGESFPGVTVLHFRQRMSIPQLRWQGFSHTSGDIVANLEASMAPAPQWVEALREAHEKRVAPVVGGPIAFDPTGDASTWQWADFLYEYGRHMAPIEDGPAAELTGANCSYQRSTLDNCQDLLSSAPWDSAIQERLSAHGVNFWRAGRAVTEYRVQPRWSRVVQQRFHFGRWHAGERRDQLSSGKRLLRAAVSPAVPFVLVLRLWRSLDGKPRGRPHLARCLPWLLLFYALWALGEACGYLFGSGSSEHRIF